MAEDVVVRFGADTAGFRGGAQEAKGEVSGLGATVQSLTDLFLVLGGTASGSFREIRTGALEAHENVKGLTESMVEFRELVTGLGEALIAAFAVEQVTEWARKMGEAGEKVEHIGLALGMTTSEVQGFQAMANATGMSLDGMTSASTRLERALGMANAGSKQQSAAFSKLGIDISQARAPAELMNETLAKFAAMPPSIEKTQIAASLFGRNLAAVAPLLGMTKDELAEVNEQTQRYGLINEDAVAQAAALGKAFNEQKNASQGLSNVFAQAFAPVMTVVVKGVNDLAAAFIRSYKEGGAAKTTIDLLVIAFKAIIEAVAAFGIAVDYVFKAVDGAAWMLAGAMQNLSDLFVGALGTMWDGLKTFGDVARDALTLHWDQIGNDIKTGTARIASDIVATSHKMGQDFAQGVQKGAREWASANHDLASFLGFSEKLWSPPKAPTSAETPQRTRGDAYGTKQKKEPQEDALSKLKEQFEAEENTHNDMIRDMTADELAFWRQVAAGPQMATLNAKQQAEVRLMIGRLEHQEAMSQVRDEMAAVKDAAAAKVAAVRDEAAQRRAAIQQQVKDVEDAEKRGVISHRTATAALDALYQQERQVAVDAANQVLAARIQADEFIKAHAAQTTSEYKQAQKDEVTANAERNKAIVAADTLMNQQIAARTRTMLDQLRAQWKTYIDGTVQAFGSGIQGMIEGTKSFRDVMVSVGEAILSTFIQIGERIVENWLVNMIANKLTSQTTGVSEVATNAAVAGSAAFASIAAIPIVGPELAPAAAAAAYAGAMSFAPLAIAAQGWGTVPYDNAPALLHKEEMVLPATLANPLRSMLAGGGAGGGAGAGAGGGGGSSGPQVTFNVSAIDGPSTLQWLRRNAGQISQVLGDAWRNGARPAGVKFA